MPKGIHEKSKDDIRRLGMDLRTIHAWDQETFGKDGRPVAYCGEHLFPRSTRLMEFPTPNRAETCGICYGD